MLWLSFVRSNRSQTFFKMDALKNFANFTGKKLCWSPFLIKLQTFKKRLQQHRCFPVKFHKFLRASFLKELLWWLLLEWVCKGTSLVKILRFCYIKGKLMQIWKSSYMFVFTWKKISWKIRIFNPRNSRVTNIQKQ